MRRVVVGLALLFFAAGCQVKFFDADIGEIAPKRQKSPASRQKVVYREERKAGERAVQTIEGLSEKFVSQLSLSPSHAADMASLVSYLVDNPNFFLAMGSAQDWILVLKLSGTFKDELFISTRINGEEKIFPFKIIPCGKRMIGICRIASQDALDINPQDLIEGIQIFVQTSSGERKGFPAEFLDTGERKLSGERDPNTGTDYFQVFQKFLLLQERTWLLQGGRRAEGREIENFGFREEDVSDLAKVLKRQLLFVSQENLERIAEASLRVSKTPDLFLETGPGGSYVVAKIEPGNQDEILFRLTTSKGDVFFPFAKFQVAGSSCAVVDCGGVREEARRILSDEDFQTLCREGNLQIVTRDSSGKIRRGIFWKTPTAKGEGKH